MRNLTKKEQNILILKYLEFAIRYGSYFDNNKLFYEFFRYLNIVRGKSISIAGDTGEILAATGATDMLDLKLWYQSNYDTMRQFFDLDDKNLVEIGAGRVPIMGDMIAKLHPTSTVTAIDPRIIPGWSKQPNLNTIRSSLLLLVNALEVESVLNSCDLLYALYPCEGAVPTIKMANELDKDLYLAMCGCKHSGFETREEYVKFILDYAKFDLPPDRYLHVIRDDYILGKGWPIIVTSKRKYK